MLNDGYTRLTSLLTDIGVDFRSPGSAQSNLGKQVMIEFADEQGGYQCNTVLYFDIGLDGSEKFICSE